MLSSQLSIGRLRAFAGKLTLGVSAIALSIFVWFGFASISNIQANAEAISDLPLIAATSGVADQVEGAAEKGIGTARRNLGDMTGDTSEQAKGAMQQAKGEGKQNLGTTKNKLDDAKDTVENKSESIIDSVKDFFE
ncbi:MAG: CsbD family protein [Pleurocapsa sp.]